jgi:hypothetical protein
VAAVALVLSEVMVYLIRQPQVQLLEMVALVQHHLSLDHQ